MAKILKEKGFAALFITIIILIVLFVIIAGLIFLALKESQISANITRSNNAYYVAEAGIEDALFRVKRNPAFQNISYAFGVGAGNAEIDISENIGGSLTITSRGEFLGAFRKIRVVYQIDFESVSFHYGAHAGEGGVEMRNNSIIYGNVFSNGNILGDQHADITDSVICAGEKIEKVSIGENAKVKNCYDSSIEGDLFYLAGGTIDCDVSGFEYEVGEVNPEDFPIPEETVEKWKDQAKEGEIISGNYTVNGVDYLGPAHIQGNLIVDNNSNLKMQGVILVSGDLTIRNNAILDLDEEYYDSFSGVIIVEGQVRLRPGGFIRGSGHPASYLMAVSLNNSLTDAIRIDNTSDGGIFFAPNGAILLNQNIKIREATAYKIILEQNAEIEYEIGLGNVFFSSGAGGGWKVLSWKEVE